MGDSGPQDAQQRWVSRRVLAHVVAALAYAVPVGAAIGVSLALSGHLPRPGGPWIEAGDWTALVGLSSAVLVVVDRLSRRLLPLAALLELSLLFPDHAPRRLAVARRAGSIRNLHARIEEAKRNGIADEPARAAERILELVGALHAHDRRTRGHSERVRALTDVLATELKLGPEDQDRLRWSALLHDIGKVHVPARILNKAGELDHDEWEAIRRHPEEGARLAAPLVPWLGEWAAVISHHHERWDGSGYPLGLRGREISQGARIVALADAYEVMTAARTYKMPMSVAAARRELTRHAGTQFDPAVVRAFLEVSIGRLRWIAGPMSWVGQVPALGWLRHAVYGTAATGGRVLGQSIGQAAGVVTTAAGTVGVAVVAGALGPAPASAASRAANPPAMSVAVSTSDPPAAIPGPADPVASPDPAAATRTAAAPDPPAAIPHVTASASAGTAPQSGSLAASGSPAGLSSSASAAGANGHRSFQPPRRRRVGWARKTALGEVVNSGNGVGLGILGDIGSRP